MGTLPDGVRVLVPRGGRPGRELADALTAAGLAPVVAPLITFREPDDAAPLDEGVARLAAGAYDWLVLTSERTVDALVAHAPGPAPALAVPATTRVAAVGPSTARRARAAGLDVDVVPVWDRTATGLLAALVGTDAASSPPVPSRTRRAPGPSERAEPSERAAELRAVRAFAPRSAIARPELVDGLRAAGWAVDAPDAYVTETATSLDDDARDVDVVVLTSSSTAETWARLAGDATHGARDPDAAHGRLVVSIGPRTTTTARTLGLRVDAQATTPDVPSLVAAVLRTLAADL